MSRNLAATDLDASALREELTSSGLSIQNTLLNAPESSRSFLCADSSYAKRDVRYHFLYCLHTVVVKAVFALPPEKDVLVGQGTVYYNKLSYESWLDAGLIKPCSDVDARLNLLRLSSEMASLASLKGKIGDIDYIIVDGSLSTIKKELSTSKGHPEHGKALKAFDALMDLNALSMVEDSHATDVSSALSLTITNLHLFDVALKPGEYVSKEDDGIHVVYVKLPAKKVCYAPGDESLPFTVRWEFSYKEFEDDLSYLVGAWMCEDDLLHPQIYPVRIADYLTRKVKANGVLAQFAQKHGLEDKYRNRRSI